MSEVSNNNLYLFLLRIGEGLLLRVIVWDYELRLMHTQFHNTSTLYSTFYIIYTYINLEPL